MSDIIISKSNHLVEAGYRLSLNETRLILLAIAQLDSRKFFPKDNMFEITAEEFSKQFQISMKDSYLALKNATTNLYERDIKTFDATGKIRGRMRWVDAVKYWDGDGKVTISFTQHIAPYLTMLHKEFTSYSIKQVSKLKTPYSIRFYELLIQFIKTGERYITLQKLREILEVTTEYPRFFDLKKYVITPSIEDINRSTDILVEWDSTRKGRSVSGLIFIFQKVPQERSDTTNQVAENLIS